LRYEIKENKNKVILKLFGEMSLDYPDTMPKQGYLGFKEKFEKSLEFDTSKKGLDLFIEVKKKITENSINVPTWVEALKDKVNSLPEKDAKSILKKNQEKITSLVDQNF